MTLALSLAPERRALPDGAQNARTRWSERRGALLTIVDRDGVRGLGEIAPLPGFSPDRLEDCKAAIAELDPAALPERLEGDVLGALERASGPIPAALPAARAGLEAALVDLWSRRAGVPAWALLAGTERSAPRAVAALASSTSSDLRSALRSARARGIGTLKVKIGRAGQFANELAALRELHEGCAGSLRVRADANQGWHDALHELGQLASLGLEFVEEPASLAGLRALECSPTPLALDESLMELESHELRAEFLRPRAVRAFVLKPTLLGGIARSARLATRAGELGIEAIVSHCFEGPVGYASACALAFAFGSQSLAHGLDPEPLGLEAPTAARLVDGQLLPWDAPGLHSGELAR